MAPGPFLNKVGIRKVTWAPQDVVLRGQDSHAPSREEHAQGLPFGQLTDGTKSKPLHPAILILSNRAQGWYVSAVLHWYVALQERGDIK